MADIQSRKTDHLDLAIGADVGFRSTTLLECVRFAHCSLPELALDQIDLSCRVLGKSLRAPLLIAGMTGGTERAGQINRSLAKIAQEHGYAFGLGSQRPMLKHPEVRESYAVRDVAPDVLLLGNIGAVQARELSPEVLHELTTKLGVDALCVHLNPAMEVVQTEGDRDFRGCEEALARLGRELAVPVIAKETGCGISRAVGRRLRALGIEHVDLSGAGGTSWVAVETHRAAPDQRSLGELFWDWGVPTAASVLGVADLGFRTVFATGGIKNGLEVAKAIALGASAAGLARPVLQALDRGGEAGAVRFLKQVEQELRTTLLLAGAKNLGQLRRTPTLIDGELESWNRYWQRVGD